MKTQILVCGLLIAIAVSGCLGGGQEQDASVSPAASSSTGATTTPATSGPGATLDPGATPTPSGPVPIANLTADIVNGSVPLSVNFTLADSAGSTVAYNWTLQFGDGNATNGTSLPATLNHTFETVDNHTAVFAIESEYGNSNASLVISAESGVVIVQTVSGAWTLGVGTCPIDSPAHAADSPLAGPVFVEFEVDAASFGLPFQAVFSGVEEPQVNIYISFYDADGVWVDRASEDSETATTLTGVVPDDASLARIGSCNGGGGSVTYASGTGL